MPENFITMFDLDSTLLRNKKISRCSKTNNKINEQIKDRRLHAFDKEKYNISDYFKTYIVKKLFYIFCMGTSKFSVDNNCNSCGLCKKGVSFRKYRII